MDSFEVLLMESKTAVERLVRYKLPSRFDAEDVLQDTYLTALLKFDSLRDKTAFKAWILTIARNKCNEYFRKKAQVLDISLEELSEKQQLHGRQGILEVNPIRETLDGLRDKDKQILYLYYFLNYSQQDIGEKLGVPAGTVKSRLHAAKAQFKKNYPYSPKLKGDFTMKKLPVYMPEYRVEPVEEAEFPVRHEELPGMLVIPRVGEKLSFGMYDFPERKLTGAYEQQVTGEVVIHGIRGVEIRSKYTEDGASEESTIFAQLTDSFCRYLGGISESEDGVRHMLTFMDGEEFDSAYKIGSDNCGFEVNRTPQGKIVLKNGELYTDAEGDVSDIVGRYTVHIGEKRYDTVRLVDIEVVGEEYMLVEYYLDRQGRTVLWRRFNRDDWKVERYGQPWSEKLPNNERLLLNGELYVHWYDCITDYIL